MKKLLLSLVAAVLAVSAWAETATFDYVTDNCFGWNTLKKDASGYIDDSEKPFACVEAPITISLNGKFRRLNQKAFGGIDCLLVYKDATITFTAAPGYKMTEITIYTATAKASNLYVSEGETTLEPEEETGEVYNHIETGVALNQTTRTAMCNSAGPIVITDPTGTQVISQIEVTYEASNLKEAGLRWSAKEFTAYINGDNSYPTLSKTTTAAVDYISENEDVATVDAATGAITLHNPGVTTIIAGCDAADGYDWGEASYTLTVKREGEKTAYYDFTAFTIDDNKVGYMTNYPDIPYNGNTTVWWTTNESEEGSYAAGSQFKPLTIKQDNTEITFKWDGKSGHGNLRATTSSKQNNLQLGNGTAMVIRPTEEGATLYDVILDINKNYTSKWESTAPNMVSNAAGKIYADEETYTVTWTPTESTSESYIDCEGGAYITGIYVNFCLKTGTGVAAVGADDTNAPEEFYNLQGMKVEHPAAGIYIVRKGSKVYKRLVK